MHLLDNSVLDMIEYKWIHILRPLCGGILLKITDPGELQKRFELIKNEWNIEKNYKLPQEYSRGSNKRVWWKCKEGHEWQAVISNRVSGDGCPYCSGRKPIIGKTDIPTLMPHLADEWDYEKNDIAITEYTVHSNAKIFWKCKKGHEWKTMINGRARGAGCPYCAGNKPIQGENDFATVCVNLLKEWNYKRNIKNPSEISSFSGLKVWWKCDKGHEWEARISDRRKGNGCPYCSGKKPIAGETDLKSQRPDLAAEWNEEKNGELTAEDVTVSAGKMVWWKCKEGHEWKARIYSRNYGRGCPYCAGQRVIVGQNDILSQNPSIAEEWDYERNNGLRPEDVCISSNKPVYWKCIYGHSWFVSPNSRGDGGCPKCSAELRTSFPEQAIWHYCNVIFEDVLSRAHLDNGMEVDIFIKGKNIAIEYDGVYYHSSEASAEREARKNAYCKQNGIELYHIREVYGNKADTQNYLYRDLKNRQGLNDVITRLMTKLGVFDADIDVNRDRMTIFQQYKSPMKKLGDIPNEDILDEWDYEKNGQMSPQMFSKASHAKFWWRCSEGHSYQAAMQKRTDSECPTGCPYCAGKKVLAGYNDLASQRKDIAEQWDYDKNETTPDMFTVSSGVSVWWKCSLGHSWQTRIVKRSAGQGCPYCSGQKVLSGFNDLVTRCKEIADEWNYEKNGDLLPTEVMKGTNKLVWWKCKEGHEWQAMINKRTSRMSKCPVCRKG